MLKVNINGLDFKNPVIAASGTFGFGAEYNNFYNVGILGGISSKGLTLNEKAGNDGIRVFETPSGMMNSVGLNNPGIDAFIEKIKSNISAEKQEDRYCYFMQKNQLLSNILELNETDKEKYLTENKKLLGLDALYVLSDTYKIENSYISRVNRETTKTEFIKNLNTNGNVKIFLEDGTELNEDNFVGTGLKVQINM